MMTLASTLIYIFNGNASHISDCLKTVGDEATFLYDFGDGWEFDIKLQEIIEDQVYEGISPWVLEGSGMKQS